MMNEILSRFDVLATLAETPGTAVAILDPQGRILFCNEYGAKMYGGGTAAEHIGRNLADLYPRDWAMEKISLLRRVAEDDDRLMIRYMWKGKRVEAQYQRIPSDGQAGLNILVTVREGVTDDADVPEGFEVVKIDTSDFGPLAVLTPREIEVLALIGQGKTAKQIGEILGCSHRTVERHRDMIGKKLNKRDRVELALIAQTAGLELRDAYVRRVDSSRPPAAEAG
jgi:DNA-binding CsgD family transcriptional regulator